jgi:hypothetical protein
MRSLFCSALVLVLALAAQPAAAQTPENDAVATMETALADAQAQAVRPGDEALTCDELQGEFTTLMQDPAIQSAVAGQGEWAQSQLDEMNAARGRAQAQMGVSIFMSLASAFIPGMGYVQMAQQQAMAAQQQAQAQANMARMMTMAEQMTQIMPQLMRGQRVHELAQTQQCPFLEGQ